MRNAHYVWIAVGKLALKGGAVVVAISVSVLMISQADDGDADPSPNPARTTESSLLGDTTQVALNVAAGRSLSHYSLRDDEGKELALVTYSRTGTLVFMLGEAFPARAGCMATPKGAYKLNVAHAGLKHKLAIEPDGASDYSVISPDLVIRDRLKVLPEGEPARVPADACRP